MRTDAIHDVVDKAAVRFATAIQQGIRLESIRLHIHRYTIYADSEHGRHKERE